MSENPLEQCGRQTEELEVLFQDSCFVAVYKPSGLLVHRSPIDRREKRFALQMVRNQVGCHVYPLHRLDRPTSGVLLFALSSDIASMAAALFQNGGMSKTYMAVVRGVIDDSGTVDHELKKVKDRMIFRQEDKEDTSYKSETDYQRLATVELPFSVDKYPTSRYSLVRLHPRTGRRHQLRRHMHRISHPIIGDTKYCKGTHNRFFRNRYNCHRLLLTAVELAFEHPLTGRQTTITAPPDSTFRSIMDAFGWGKFASQREASGEK